MLIVDDNPANVTLLARLLESAELCEVYETTDSERAVELCLEVEADLLLLDLHMPHKDGFAVMDELQEALPDDAFLPVIVLTADTTEETRVRALEAGANDFLTKPLDRNEVLLRVRNMLETCELHARLRRDKAALQADLSRRLQRNQEIAQRRRRRREQMDRLLSGDALEMVFQPIVQLGSGSLLGAEALARFRCEPHRPPNEWFDEAAALGRGPTLELNAVRAALARLAELPDDVFLTVNVSPTTATHPALGEVLEAVPGERIVIELTEHTRIDHYEPLMAALEAIRARGVRVAVDDAGAGYAGLQQILRLRPDLIKLDTTLTRGLDGDLSRRSLTSAMVTFAREIDAVLIAEGIETWEELRTLRELGVDCGQGFLIGRPGDLPLAAQSIGSPTFAASPV